MDAAHPSSDTSVSERLGALAGLIACLAVGVATVLEGRDRDAALSPAPDAVWWAGYLGYLGVFVALSQFPDTRLVRRLGTRPLVVTQAALGVAVFLLGPDWGWVPVLFVVTAASAAYELSRLATAAIVIGQTALLGVASLTGQVRAADLVIGMAVYGSFQAFAVVVIWVQQREAASRAALADANDQLQAATARLAATSRSEERLRIARELHDLVGHQLTALTLELEVATNAPPGTDREHLDRARTIARELLRDVREAVGELRSPAGTSLRAALQHVTDPVPRPSVRLHVDDELEVDDATAHTLVRCVQEVVTNAVRHADANVLQVEVARGDDGGLVLTACDDGRGAPAVRAGHGLTGLTERVTALGGTVRVDTAPGEGLRLEARLPAP